MSGAGRSTAAKALEDLGCFVVDNLPPQLLADVVAAGRRTHGTISRSRSWSTSARGAFFAELHGALAASPSTAAQAARPVPRGRDDVLVRRQEAARRPHPLQERRPAAGRHPPRARSCSRRPAGDADLVIDTSDLNVHQLADEGRRPRSADEDKPALRATVVSFGFKYGIPVDADLVADMRFLPNPHWVPELRPLSGWTTRVRDYVLGQPAGRDVPGRSCDACSEHRRTRLPPRGQAVHDRRRRLHRRQAPQRRRWPRRSPQPAARAGHRRRARRAPRPRPAEWTRRGGGRSQRGGPRRRPRLSASLRALRAFADRPDRRRHRRRQRRVLRPAAARVRRAAPG